MLNNGGSHHGRPQATHTAQTSRLFGLLVSSCKIMESLIRDSLVEFTESNNILTKHQHGFMQHHSCLTNLLEALKAWAEALDRD